MTPDLDQERRENRFLAGIRAFLTLGERRVLCRARDLSRTGVLLTGLIGDLDERDVLLRLESVAGDLTVDLRGQVMNLRQVEDDHVEIGVQFDVPDDDARERLEALVARAMEGTLPAPIAELSPRCTAAEARAVLDVVPKPHRIQLARRADVDLRAKLRHDRDPQVIEALLRNPHLTPPELMAMVRSREMMTPQTLAVVADDPRWSGNDEIKLIVATHPRVSLQVARKVVDRMSDACRKRAIRRPGLPEAIRNKLVASYSAKGLQGW